MRFLTLCLLFVTQSVAFSATPCASTPATAIQAFEDGAITNTTNGFRVIKLHTDATLNVTWADLKHCDHPEWPTLRLATHATAPHAVDASRPPAEAPAIRPGQTVRAWRNQPNAHLEMPAISDQAGAVGDRIRLHIATPTGEPVRVYYGRVRGPANVEME